MRRRARLLTVVAILATAALGVIAATQVWFTVTIAGGAEPLEVLGADAAPLLTPLSLAALALGAALSIAGLVLRHVFGLLCVLLGVALGALTWPLAISQPVEAVASTVTGATGITGRDAVAELIAGIDATAWPAIAAAAWVLLVAAGIAVLVTARRWPAGDRRYRTDIGAAAARGTTDRSRPADAIDSWDDLSRGDDPTA